MPHLQSAGQPEREKKVVMKFIIKENNLFG
jgi:hypothetical protein